MRQFDFLQFSVLTNGSFGKVISAELSDTNTETAFSMYDNCDCSINSKA